MSWLILLLFLVVIIEITAGILPVSPIQKVLSALSIFIIGADSMLIVGLRPAVWTVLLAYLSAFRVVNLCKLIAAHKQINYLRSTFLRAASALVIYQLLVLVVDYLLDLFGWSYQGKWVGLALVNLIIVLTFFMSLRRSLITTRPKFKDKFSENSKLPDVTVAIPARNETEDLESCLISLINSDYPKLEILVLDDCSQEKRTPEIIRQFAHDGVRFIEGKPVSDSWTAKNHAYQQLADEANGDVILFCGVDVRFDQHTISSMINLKNTKKKTMMSFMPVNNLPPDKFSRLLLQPIRYLWELALPRRSLNRPPVLSTCWLIDGKSLIDNGSFKAVSRSIMPERYFARQSTRQNDGYSFVCLGDRLGLVSAKSLDEQLDTAVRTRYPLVKQRIENISALSLVELSLVLGPIALLIYGLFSANWWLVVPCLINIIVTSLMFFRITKLTYDKNLGLSILAWPIVFCYDISLGIYSMWRYEFSEVLWKGRNVCIPVMHLLD